EEFNSEEEIIPKKKNKAKDSKEEDELTTSIFYRGIKYKIIFEDFISQLKIKIYDTMEDDMGYYSKEFWIEDIMSLTKEFRKYKTPKGFAIYLIDLSSKKKISLQKKEDEMYFIINLSPPNSDSDEEDNDDSEKIKLRLPFVANQKYLMEMKKSIEGLNKEIKTLTEQNKDLISANESMVEKYKKLKKEIKGQKETIVEFKKGGAPKAKKEEKEEDKDDLKKINENYENIMKDLPDQRKELREIKDKLFILEQKIEDKPIEEEKEEIKEEEKEEPINNSEMEEKINKIVDEKLENFKEEFLKPKEEEIPQHNVENKGDLSEIIKKIDELEYRISNIENNMKDYQGLVNSCVSFYGNKGAIKKNDPFGIAMNDSLANKKFKGKESVIIHNPNELKVIEDRLYKMLKKHVLKYNKLYQGSIDGDSVAIFHSKCDGIKNTLVLVETAGTARFGGFTKMPWKSDLDEGEYFDDEDAFLFSLNNKKIFEYKADGNAICCHKDYGPIFGLGNDFAVGDKFITTESSWTYETSQEASYEPEDEGTEYKLAEVEFPDKFKIKELEVFEVIFA
ncbi:MAG: TLD domain-containing protein, partial [archaeon]|nr:TLD domain-containing protein [archaeon]